MTGLVCLQSEGNEKMLNTYACRTEFEPVTTTDEVKKFISYYYYYYNYYWYLPL
jgi:hypothetical protein